MKTRFNTFDLICGVVELQRLIGLRVNQIYDIDSKTYLIRLHGSGEETKTVLLIESGVRFHTTVFDWPKNNAPSGFSMKLRKHLKNKRLEKLQQLGGDRIVDFQFGTSEAAYHVILELYDRGNIILTDHELTILYVLRPHHEGEEVRFAVREKYPQNRAKVGREIPNENELKEIITAASPGDNLRRILMPFLDSGPSIIDHVLTKYKLDCCVIEPNTTTQLVEESSTQDNNTNAKEGTIARKRNKKQKLTNNTRPFDVSCDMPKLLQALQDVSNLLTQAKSATSRGYIIQKMEEKPPTDGETVEHFYQNIEYHPLLLNQYDGQPFAEYETFMLAVDEFYSSLEGQKIDVKTFQQEREALKKLSNVKKDHAKRLEELTKVQEQDKRKAELITCNQALVDNAILAIRSAIAHQMSWPDIHELVKVAQGNGDIVANAIKQLKLEINHIAIKLTDPYYEEDNANETKDYPHEECPSAFQVVDIDLALSAWANARKYYDQKRSAAKKEQKTIDASQKALKSAERKTQQTLKDVRTISTISKMRKVYWFEKFYWFISSENYLIIGGRDAQQNELIVKRYMRTNDIYVHAEIQGASSVVVRNCSGDDIPPKTLLEAGTMAISYSKGWDAKVVTNAYWVRSEQVSKTAPTGEYLGTGSFMVRGKKNFLPSCHLIMGLSLLFRLEDDFVERHRGERKVRAFDDERDSDEQHMERRLRELVIENEQLDEVEECLDVDLEDGTMPDADQKLSDDDSNGNNDDGNYPDTQVKIEHDTGRVTLRSDSFNESELTISKQENLIEKCLLPNVHKVNEDEATIIPAAPSRKKQQKNSKKRKEEKGRKFDTVQQQNIIDLQAKPAAQMKRGQKGKLKKIKSKYRDQDDEERELRMKILKSSGSDKLNVADTQQHDVAVAVNNKHLDNKQIKGATDTTQHEQEQEQQQQLQETDADNADEVPPGVDMEVIDALTGQPFDDDELLFVIPVVAPYQSLQNYKFKVKLTPGTGKRGRAAKTALTMFAKDKGCTQREKDLFKSIREEALARNIPGKVKLSAPQMLKFKKQ